MFVFQTVILNVFGCTDLLPFTGVTFPFVERRHQHDDRVVGTAGIFEVGRYAAKASLAVKGGART